MTLETAIALVSKCFDWRYTRASRIRSDTGWIFTDMFMCFLVKDDGEVINLST